MEILGVDYSELQKINVKNFETFKFFLSFKLSMKLNENV